jgi:Protein of unknown function (DUF1345)
MVTKRRAKVSDEKPDPIRRKTAKLVDVIEEPSEAALAKPVAREAATGAPPAGRTTLEDARAQVSDTDIIAKPIRKAALRHAVLSYVFGVVILATTINVVASLLAK